jgi:hypothetical protein
MSKAVLRLLVALALCVVGSTVHAAPQITPSGPLRAFKGPEGEVIVMVEINDSKEMLVHLKGVGGDLEGRTLRYLFEDDGKGDKSVYVNKKRGSKTYRSQLLTARDNAWTFFYPDKPSVTFRIRYSESASEKFKIEDVIRAIKP